MNLESKKRSLVYDYFTITEDGLFFMCLAKDNNDSEICGEKFSAYAGKGANKPSRASNLKCHLQRHHSNLLKIISEKESSRNKKTDSRQLTLNNYFGNNKVTVSMTTDKFKSCISEMVFKNSVPLTFFSSSAFIGLAGEMANKVGVSLERNNVRNLILEDAYKQKDLLKNLLRGKFIFLKIDACTRNRVNYLAINVQFVDDSREVIVRTLAVKDSKSQHTSDSIKKIVVDVLEDFNIKSEQILTIMTDNAHNMMSTVEKLNPVQHIDEIDTSDDSGSDPSLDEFGEAASELFKIHHMRCAVHTLQLAIRDGLRDRHATRIIECVRKIVVAARTPKINEIIKRRAGKGAILDQVTRWSSTYMMIERLLECKSVLKDMVNPSVTMTEAEWKDVEELEVLLRHSYIVTKKFQAVNLTPGVFYKEWKSLIFRYSKSNTNVAKGIKNAMLSRENNLLNNNILLAGIYVDPMVRSLLTEEQKNRAKDALFELAIRMKGLRSEDQAIVDETTQIELSYSASDFSGKSEDDFEKYLDEQERIKRRRLDLKTTPEKSNHFSEYKNLFYDTLEKVNEIDRSKKLDIKTAILRYPEIIQDSALTVTALPPTQVSVERLFSALKIIKSDLRASINPDLIEAILFLRSNSI